MTDIDTLRFESDKAQRACLKRISDMELLITRLRASLLDAPQRRSIAYQIEMKGRSVAEAFAILDAKASALNRASKAKAS